MADYIRRSFYWLFYLTPQPVAQWVSDLPAQTDLSFQMVLPPWFPRKTYLCHAWVGYGSGGTPDGSPVELYLLHDPGGIWYKAGDPPGAEVNAAMVRCSTLAYQYFPSQYQDFHEYQLDPPICFDRDAGDKLWFGYAGSNPIGWVWMTLSFLQAMTSAPANVGPEYWPR